MTTAADLLAHLAARGVILTVDGDKLKVDAPAGAVTPAMRATLAARKAEIVAHLAGDERPTPEPPAPPEIMRIPLTWDYTPGEWAAARGLRVVGGTAHFGGAAFRPMLYLAETETEAAA